MIHENDLASCAVIPVGLGREAGILPLQFFSGRSMDTSASIVPDFRPEQPVTHTTFVPVFPYVEVERAAGIDRLGLVKIDVEGAESDVLASMAAALRAHTPIIVVEILPCYRADNHARLARQQEIEALMASLDYELYRIGKGADDSLRGLTRIAEIGVHGDLSKCDYVFAPRSRREAIRRALDVRD
jgi:FkbM family methyltransferase